MIINTSIPLDHAHDFPSRQVGKFVLEYIKMGKKTNCLPSGFVIPIETLKRIAHHNDLTQKVRLLQETNDWTNPSLEKKLQKKISHLIRKQSIPEDVAHDIIKSYHDHIKGKVFTKIQSKTVTIENVIGETNLLESLLTVWSKSTKTQDLFASPLMITEQGQAESAGFVIPHPVRKTRYLIYATQGVIDYTHLDTEIFDYFELDASNKTIISRQLNPRTKILKRKLDGYTQTSNSYKNKAALTDNEALQVLSLADVVNKNQIGSKRILFEFRNNKLILTGIKQNKPYSPDPNKLVLMGTSVTGGFIEGTVQIITTSREQLTTGNILVKKSLSHKDLHTINNASALLIEDQTLSQTTLALIKERHLPCVIGLTGATKKLRNGQQLTVDSGSGKIYQKSNQPLVKKPDQATITKIYVSAGNPYRSDLLPTHTEGVFLKSDYALALLGTHPNHLIKQKKHILLDNLEKTIQTFFTKEQKNLFYRSCNLNSLEMRSLQQSMNYEHEDSSPYIGHRGAVRIIEDPTIFKFELQAIEKFTKKYNREVNFVMPFVRTPSELALLFQIIEDTIPKSATIHYWLQLNTPANILRLPQYLHLPIQGVTIQAKTIHDLAYGIDPDNPDLGRKYSFDHDLIGDMLAYTVRTIKESHHFRKKSVGQLPVILKLNMYDAQLVKQASQHGIRAIVVKPPLLDIVKQQVIESETEMISKRS